MNLSAINRSTAARSQSAQNPFDKYLKSSNQKVSQFAQKPAATSSTAARIASALGNQSKPSSGLNLMA